MIYIGIDNGISGGIAVISNRRELTLHQMPVVKDGRKSRVDVLRLQSILEAHSGCHVSYERPAGSKSVTAAVSMADSFARIDTLLCLLKIRREPLLATRWQRTYWKKPKMPRGQKFDTKAAALAAANRLWPTESFLATSCCRKPHDGLVDAALIAEYARRAQL